MEPVLVRPDRSFGGADLGTVSRAREGDSAAFEDLVRTRVDRLYRTACAILGNEADGGDATQEAFIAAWRQLPRLRELGRFDAWLTQILVNACRMRLRTKRRVREVSSSEPAQAERDGRRVIGYATHDALADEIAGAERLARAFDRLTIDQRTVLTMLHLHHQSVSEIATALGRPAGTIKWRLHDARSALERALEVEDHD